MVGELRTELQGHRPVTSQLKAIHDAVRGLRTELDLSRRFAAGAAGWSRSVPTCPTCSRPKSKSAPGRTRRLLRPRPVKEIAPGSVLNAIDVNEAETLIEFVATCRNYAGELAVNEVTMRSFSELQNYLETGTRVLLDALRLAGDADRPFRQSQLDAAIRFCRIVFGADYAGTRRKGRRDRDAICGCRAQTGPRLMGKPPASSPRQREAGADARVSALSGAGGTETGGRRPGQRAIAARVLPLQPQRRRVDLTARRDGSQPPCNSPDD